MQGFRLRRFTQGAIGAAIALTFLMPAGVAQKMNPEPLYGWRDAEGQYDCVLIYFYFGSYNHHTGLWEELRWCAVTPGQRCVVFAWQVYQFRAQQRYEYPVGCLTDPLQESCLFYYREYCKLSRPW